MFVALLDPSARRAPPLPPLALRTAVSFRFDVTLTVTPVRTPVLLLNCEMDLLAKVELLEAEMEREWSGNARRLSEADRVEIERRLHDGET